MIEADADVGWVPVDDSKLGSDRLPSERLNRLLDLHRIHRNLLLPHMEDLKVIVHPGVLDIVLVLLNFGVTVDFNAEVVSGLLPVDLAVGNGEQVLGAYFGAVGDLQ